MKFRFSLLLGLSSILLVISLLRFGHRVRSQEPSPVRRVNVPHDPDLRQSEAAIFWFGEVTPTNNYADVRVTHNDELLQVTVHIFDQWLWRDGSPTPGTLEQWDAATVYLNLSGNAGGSPSQDSYRFVAQLSHFDHEPRASYQTAYRGDGAGWISSDIPFQSRAGWRGQGFNDGSEARGWWVMFQIPFADLDLSGAPSLGDIWGLAVAVHDRDDAAGTLIPDQTWPEVMDASTPATWGQIHFGLPVYLPPPAAPEGSTTVRHGLNGATVMDGHVGGYTICGQPFWPDGYFAEWGDANYAGDEKFNIQNQWDVADWPCFSKYYVTFPLDAVPHDKSLISATLTLYQFGNAGQDSPPAPQSSLIQVLALEQDWDDETLTWNNAPLPVENLARAWVEPIDQENYPGWPGVPREWDVSLAVSKALQAGTPLRLSLYSADTAQNSGKYFTASDVGSWNEEGRPALHIVWGTPFENVFEQHLPLLHGK